MAVAESSPFLPIAPPRFPPRNVYVSGDTPEAIGILESWVQGVPFHPYAERRPWTDELWQARKDYPAILRFDGELSSGRLRWRVFYWREGDPEGHGSSSGYSCAADAARGALEMIEADEREAFETALVIGVA